MIITKDKIIIKKRVVRIAAILLAVVLLSFGIGAIIGYRLGMQIPQARLVGDVKLQELANISAVIYGSGGMLLRIIGSIIYIAILSTRRTK